MSPGVIRGAAAPLCSVGISILLSGGEGTVRLGPLAGQLRQDVARLSQLVGGEDAVHEGGVAGGEREGGGEGRRLEDDETPDGAAALEQRSGEADPALARERAEVLEVGGPVPAAEFRRAGAVATDEGEQRHRADSIAALEGPRIRVGAGLEPLPARAGRSSCPGDAA